MGEGRAQRSPVELPDAGRNLGVLGGSHLSSLLTAAASFGASYRTSPRCKFLACQMRIVTAHTSMLL